ncbi:MAG: hypothetical protein AB7L28_21890 [Kofleriaceae bacterium]
MFLKADDNSDVGLPLMIGGGVVMAGSYISGGIGYFRVKRCRKAVADYNQRMLVPAPMPVPVPSPGLPPPPPPR